MARWPDKDGSLLIEFLDSLNAPTKRWLHTDTLRSFQSQCCRRPPNENTLQTWLQSLAAKHPTYRVIRGGRVAARFLDWLLARRLINANPFEDLRGKYNLPSRSTAPIIRALIDANPSTALEALRPVPRYASHLGPVMHDHVLRMRSLGFRYQHEDRFVHFDRFLQTRPNAATESLSKLVHEYAAAAPSPAGRLQRLGTGKIVAQALTRNGTPTPPIVADRLLIREVMRKRVGPYIYSPEQVALMLQTARGYSDFRAKLRPKVLYAMFILAYCAGLRLGEIVRLQLKDVDLREGTIDVRGTKFFKSRRLPISVSALAALAGYLDARRKSGASLDPEARVFVHEKGGYSIVTAGDLAGNVIRRALNTPKRRGGPRFHDLRHTFVVHRMIEWYRQGINPQSRLPYLATYLGHRDIHSTLVYLAITQDLLQQANSRFRTAEASVLKAIKGESSNA